MVSHTAIKQLRNGWLAIHPDSISWVVSDSQQELHGFNFDETLISTRLAAISKDRLRRHIDQFEIHLSDRCNLRCSYCYVPENLLSSSPSLSSSDIDHILGKVTEFCEAEGYTPRIHFHGGEPGLSIKLIKNTVEKYGDYFQFAIQTNGTAIKDSDLDWLIEKKVEIGLSIDGFGTSNGLRHGAQVERIVSSLEKLISACPIPPSVLCTISNANVGDLLQTCEHLYGLGINNVSLNPVTAYLPFTSTFRPEEDTLIRSYFECVNFALDRTRSSPRKPFFINNMESIAMAVLTSRSASYCEMSPCGAGRLMAVIDAKGQLFPCSGLIANDEFSCGSVLADGAPLVAMLDSPPVASFQERQLSAIPGCSTCVYRQICGANCPIPYANRGESMLQRSTWCHFRTALIDRVFEEAISDPSNVLDFICYESRASLFGAKVSHSA